MEQNKEMTAQESLQLITETMNNSRKAIVRRSGKYFMLWGGLLTLISLLVFFLWNKTGKPDWNFLWFAMPAIGYPLAMLMKKNEQPQAENTVSRLLTGVWRTFGVFAISVAIFSIIYPKLNPGPLGLVVVGVSLSSYILLLFGISLAISGVAIKNRAIIIAGYVTGIGGIIIYYLIDMISENPATGVEMLLFTFAGIVLALTGVVIKLQNK